MPILHCQKQPTVLFLGCVIPLTSSQLYESIYCEHKGLDSQDTYDLMGIIIKLFQQLELNKSFVGLIFHSKPEVLAV